MELCAYPTQEKIRCYDIEAIEIPIVYNKYGDHDPNGLVYVLKKDAERIKEKAWEYFNREIPQPYEEVRPLVIRANRGETIHINIHPNAYNVLADDGEGIRYEYDSDGNNIRIHYPDGGCERIFYDAEGKRIKHVLPEYYDPALDDGKGTSYEYDSAGRLIRVTEPEGNLEAAYTYDLDGNVTSKTDALGNTGFYAYNLNGALIQSLTPSKEENGEILYQKITFSYDGNGNRTKEHRHSGYWDQEGSLRREDGTLLAESWQDETVTSRYILGYGVASGWHKEKEGYHPYHLDEQNSTAYITDAGQQIENSYQYDAFGIIRGRDERIHNRILYTGQQHDQVTGQYYLRARYYNPVVGRFLQEDVYRGDGLMFMIH